MEIISKLSARIMSGKTITKICVDSLCKYFGHGDTQKFIRICAEKVGDKKILMVYTFLDNGKIVVGPDLANDYILNNFSLLKKYLPSGFIEKYLQVFVELIEKVLPDNGSIFIGRKETNGIADSEILVVVVNEGWEQSEFLLSKFLPPIIDDALKGMGSEGISSVFKEAGISPPSDTLGIGAENIEDGASGPDWIV